MDRHIYIHCHRVVIRSGLGDFGDEPGGGARIAFIRANDDVARDIERIGLGCSGHFQDRPLSILNNETLAYGSGAMEPSSNYSCIDSIKGRVSGSRSVENRGADPGLRDDTGTEVAAHIRAIFDIPQVTCAREDGRVGAVENHSQTIAIDSLIVESDNGVTIDPVGVVHSGNLCVKAIFINKGIPSIVRPGGAPIPVASHHFTPLDAKELGGSGPGHRVGVRDPSTPFKIINNPDSPIHYPGSSDGDSRDLVNSKQRGRLGGIKSDGGKTDVLFRRNEDDFLAPGSRIQFVRWIFPNEGSRGVTRTHREHRIA